MLELTLEVAEGEEREKTMVSHGNTHQWTSVVQNKTLCSRRGKAKKKNSNRNIYSSLYFVKTIIIVESTGT